MKFKILYLILCGFFVTLSACSTSPYRNQTSTNLPLIGVSSEQADLSLKANKLVTMAQHATTNEDELNYRIRAAHLFLEIDDLSSAKQQTQILSEKQLANTSSNISNTSLLILKSKIAFAEHKVPLAQSIADKITPITKTQHRHYYRLKANLAEHAGHSMQVVNNRVDYNNYITDPTETENNNKKIWRALSNLTTTQLWQNSDNPITNGWLDLAKVVRTGQQNNNQFEDALLNWGMRNPSHPANNNFLKQLINVYQTNTVKQRHIAVFLPLQGVYAKTMSTIKNGILSAYYEDTRLTNKSVIKFYDTADKSKNFYQLYQQAIDAGATNIIGPIDKKTISQLTQRDYFDVPILTLNYTDTQIKLTKNLVLFGLSPEDEARQVAEYAIAHNKRNAAIFFPDNSWGRRLQQAFSERYNALGGTVRTQSSYPSRTNDYRGSIRHMLNLDTSKIRRRSVESTLSRNIKGEPRRRQDIDMIFLAATHRQARGIMPALKFHRAGNIAVYATSHIYTGHADPRLDIDLNGIVFCDMPWVLQNNSPLLHTFKSNWPQQQNLTRLFALGVDAYHLVYNLAYLKNKEYAIYEGQTGKLRLDNLNKITRQLIWAKFKNGKATNLSPVQLNTVSLKPKPNKTTTTPNNITTPNTVYRNTRF